MGDDEGEIERLIAALSTARWNRILAIGAKGENMMEEMFKRMYTPSSDKEKAIWEELTCANNYSSLRHYVEYWRSRGRNELAEAIQEAAVAAADARRSQAEDTS